MSIPSHDPAPPPTWAQSLDIEYKLQRGDEDIEIQTRTVHLEADGDVVTLRLDDTHTIYVKTGELLISLGHAIAWEHTRFTR